jgi:methanethiol S-methyltransferase
VHISPAGARVVAWAGAVVFAASLTYFLFSYLFTFGEMTAGGAALVPVATDVALFSGFALHHSVCARERVRAWMARVFPPTLERSIYVWVASLMLIAVCAMWQPVPGVAWQINGPAIWVLRGVQLAGIWLSLRGAAVIDVWELAGVRQPSIPAARPRTLEHGGVASRAGAAGTETWDFKTDGPYGWIRHPIYLGWFLMVFAVGTMTMTRLLFAVTSSVYILIAIPLEERSLLRASGGAYETYAREVRWKLLPYVF